MGKIIVSEFISLDGVIEAPQNWHFPFVSDDMQEVVNAGIHSADAFLYGRVTYEEFAPFWSTQKDNAFGIGDKLNNTPKYVVSNTLQSADWHKTSIIKGDLAQEINNLKQQISGTIAITGSAKLIQALMKHHLVDELHLMVHPVVVGSGKRLFSDAMDKAELQLLQANTYRGGVVDFRYAAKSSS